MEKKPIKRGAVKKVAPLKKEIKKTEKKSSAKRMKKSVNKTKKFETNYTLEYDEKKGEVDLHFDLTNPVEDRFFAYSLTLMDLHRTLESVVKIAPPEVVESFITALKVLKGLSEAIKLNVEFEAGLIDKPKPGGAASGESKSRIKKMIETLKEKLEKKHPGAKIIVKEHTIRKDDPNETALEKALRQMQDEVDGVSNENLGNNESNDRIERNDRPVRKPSQDLEL